MKHVIKFALTAASIAGSLAIGGGQASAVTQQQYFALSNGINSARSHVAVARNKLHAGGHFENSPLAGAKLAIVGQRLDQAGQATIQLGDCLFTDASKASLLFGRACLAAGGARVYLASAIQALQQPPFDGLESDALQDVIQAQQDIDEARSSAGCP